MSDTMVSGISTGEKEAKSYLLRLIGVCEAVILYDTANVSAGTRGWVTHGPNADGSFMFTSDPYKNSVKVMKNQFEMVWSGLGVGDEPIGGWQRLRELWEATSILPAVGHTIRDRYGQEGTVKRVSGMVRVSYALADLDNWLFGLAQQFQYLDDLGSYHPYKVSVKAFPTRFQEGGPWWEYALKDLPKPYSLTRNIIQAKKLGVWSAIGADGNTLFQMPQDTAEGLFLKVDRVRLLSRR